MNAIFLRKNEGPHLFPKGDNYQIAKIFWRNLKILFSRTKGQISTKFGTKHSWVVEIQVCSNKGPRLLSRGSNYKIPKTRQQNSKIFSRATGPNSTKLGSKHPLLKETQGFTNKNHSILKKKIMFFLSSPIVLWYNHRVYWIKLVSHVSDVAHMSYQRYCIIIARVKSMDRAYSFRQINSNTGYSVWKARYGMY